MFSPRVGLPIDRSMGEERIRPPVRDDFAARRNHGRCVSVPARAAYYHYNALQRGIGQDLARTIRLHTVSCPREKPYRYRGGPVVNRHRWFQRGLPSSSSSSSSDGRSFTARWYGNRVVQFIRQSDREVYSNFPASLRIFISLRHLSRPVIFPTLSRANSSTSRIVEGDKFLEEISYNCKFTVPFERRDCILKRACIRRARDRGCCWQHDATRRGVESRRTLSLRHLAYPCIMHLMLVT